MNCLLTSKCIKHILGILLLCVCLLVSPYSISSDIDDENHKQLVVVVNVKSSTSVLSKKQLIDIYMGRFKSFPNGDSVTPLDFKNGSDQKKYFYKTLVDKSERKIAAYWSRLLFSGRATPPEQVDSIEQIQNLITQDPSALAYLYASDLTQEMKIVYRFN